MLLRKQLLNLLQLLLDDALLLVHAILLVLEKAPRQSAVVVGSVEKVRLVRLLGSQLLK